MVLNGSIF